ncbi:MAG TPA: hypothetical protein PLG23_17090 [Thermoflexales bacterium]|nr:hypothetical protein [Anaerolineae bacterium]HQV29885.1 hypothetical protein [Thermoflexales bacterium]HQX12215.1 hypothetical protein [Thermoflexales bacterium]HQY25539.1 hypothetical protein [Thermoflexales bacterium]HQZ55183.1 hypothetical protein [Thermoflexales bacterium]
MNWKPDITFARVAGEQMDEYVHAEVLFFPVGGIGGMQMPALTIGTWLETAWRLGPAPLASPEQAILVDARAAVTRIRARVPQLYEAKARREFKSRLESMSMWLEDLPPRREPRAPAPAQHTGYLAQAHLRLKLELLREDVSQTQDLLQRLRGWDDRLRAMFAAGPFVFEPEVEAAAIPRERYWFLFGGI